MTAKPIILLFALAIWLSPISEQTNQAQEESNSQIKSISLHFMEIPDSRSGLNTHYLPFDSSKTTKTAFSTSTGELLIRRNGSGLEVDRNGDGKIDQDDGKTVLKGETFYITSVVGGQTVQYPIRVTYFCDDYALCHSKAALLGKNGEQQVLIYDHDMDGKLGEPVDDQFKLSKYSQETLLEAMASGDHAYWTKDMLPMTTTVSLNQNLYNVEVEDEGKCITLKPYTENTAKVQVKSKAPYWNIQLSHKDGKLFKKIRAGEDATLIPGEYQMNISSLHIPLSENRTYSTKKDALNDRARLTGRGSEPLWVTFKEGDNTLEIGPPLQLEFGAYAWGKNKDRIEIKDAYLKGVAGEEYMFNLKGSFKYKLEVLVRSGDSELRIGELSYG